jgi:hypothetical protein
MFRSGQSWRTVVGAVTPELYARGKIRQSMAERLRDVLYRTACIAAVLRAIFVLVVAPALAHPDWTIWTPVAAAGAIAIWGIGRAARYLLSGH